MNRHSMLMMEIVQWLLRSGGSGIAEANTQGDTALPLGASCGKMETVRWLLSTGGASIAEANNTDMTALLRAA
jgi:hypothetical protein